MKRRHIAALAWAVREAEGWRGSLVGNPDPGPLMEFDANIAAAKEALKDLRRDARNAQRPKANYEKH